MKFVNTTLIGFATQYYTYWHYTECPIYSNTKDGKSHLIGIRQNYTYIKNLSKDLETAKNKYIKNTKNQNPDWDMVIDNSLRGETRSFYREKRTENIPKEYFNVGKYYGELISECKDISYLEWAYKNILSDEQREIAFKILGENGYMIHTYESGETELMTVEEVEDLKRMEEHNKYIDSLQKGLLFNDGEKVELLGKCIGKKVKDGYYGTVYTYWFDVDGMQIRYEGSKEYPQIEEMEEYKLSGTVKHTSYYSEWENRQLEYTKLLRMKVEQLQTSQV